MNLKGKSILITGGAGTLGQAITARLLNDFPAVKRIVIFSRDEQKHFEMMKRFSPESYPVLDYKIGNVRDLERLDELMPAIDLVIHAAAMKHVHIAEANPKECYKTNVGGAENVIESALKNGVKNVVALSTDKACSPTGVYGKSKRASDQLFIDANKQNSTCFSVVRYGNVMGCPGTVIPSFIAMRKQGALLLTHPDMTRFTITIDHAVEMVFNALQNAIGGELYVPKLSTYKLSDLAKAIAPNLPHKVVGVRPGEKMHEEMLNVEDYPNVYAIQDYFVVLPEAYQMERETFMRKYNAKPTSKGFSYNSLESTTALSVKELRLLIEKELNLDLSSI